VWKFEVYDEDENKLFPNTESLGVNPLDFLQKGTYLACIVQCGGLWFANGKFGITWRLAQAIVQKPKATIGGKCLLKLKTTDKEKLKAQVVPIVEHVDDIALSVVVEDSDNEDEEVHVQETVATPAPIQIQIQVQEKVVEEQVAAPVEQVVEKKVVKKVIKKKE